MIRRILMVLLVACLAVPAVAMPVSHEAAPAAKKGHCDDPQPAAPDDGKAAAPHGCIGCLAPFHTDGAPPPPLSMRGPERVNVLIAQRLLISGAPEPPPPRA